VSKVTEYRAEAAKLTGEPSIALLFRYLSASRLVTIAQIGGRVRAAGSEFVLACDIRFGARVSRLRPFEPASVSSPEVVLPSTHASNGSGRTLEDPERGTAAAAADLDRLQSPRSRVIAAHNSRPGEGPVIALGVILLIIGFIAKVAILWTIGIVLLVIGLVLALLGMMGRAVGGRAHYY
jgi:hypothetical protein